MNTVMPTTGNSESLLDQLATASLAGRDVERRGLWLEMLEHCDASKLPKPRTQDAVLLALAAASAEMLAEQQGVEPPAWSASVGPVPGEPVYLARRNTPRGRHQLVEESPEPLRSRGFYASANYVSLV